MKYLITLFLSTLFCTVLTAEPLYKSKSDFLQKKLYGIEIELDRSVNSNKKRSLNNLSAVGTPDIEASFNSASPWLSGINWGGTTFNGSLSAGKDFFGSSLTDADLVPVQIIFSNTDSTLCQTFRRDLNYASNGVGVFPGTAWDMSDTANPRQLNIGFVEAASMASPNFIWDPGTNIGNREYVFIFLSSYDGTGTTYAGNNINSGASSMDILFAFWPDIATGYTLLETLPATLDIGVFQVKNARVIPDTTENILTWRYDNPTPDHFNIYAGTTNPPPLLTTVSGNIRSYTHSSLTTGIEYFYSIEAATISDSIVANSKQVSGITQMVYSNINLVGYLHEYNKYGDIWGYTDGGTEYALLCVRDLGVSIIDITADPPVEVGFMNPTNPGVDSKDIKIYQNYAILVNESDNIQIFDLTDVTNPVLISTFTPDGGGTHNCIVEGNYLYVVGNHGTGGLEIVDISNPFAPVEIGQFQPFYYHDIDIRNDTIIGTGIYGDGIDIIDVSNKSAPSLISRFNYAGSGSHNAEYSSDGTHVFIGDEIGSSGNHIRAFDISDPLNVSMVSEFIIDTNAVVHNSYIFNDTFLVIGHYTLGIRIWNVADPANPFEVAYYDTFLKDEFSYQGCWSVYPYFASGKIIASDMQSGLFVLEPTFLGSPSCCIGDRGNVNGGPDDGTLSGSIDISDVVFLVAYMFQGGPPYTCEEEADINGTGGGTPIDISDLVALIEFMFGGGAPPAPCP